MQVSRAGMSTETALQRVTQLIQPQLENGALLSVPSWI